MPDSLEYVHGHTVARASVHVRIILALSCAGDGILAGIPISSPAQKLPACGPPSDVRGSLG